MTVFLLRKPSLFSLLGLFPAEHPVNILFDRPKLFFVILGTVVYVVSFVFLRYEVFNFGVQRFGSRQFFNVVTLKITDCRFSQDEVRLMGAIEIFLL